MIVRSGSSLTALAMGLWVAGAGLAQAQDEAAPPQGYDEAEQGPQEGAEAYPDEAQPQPEQYPAEQYPAEQQHYGAPPHHPPGPAHGPLPHEEELKPAPNSIYLEGLGAGLFYSLNYERRFIDDLGVRVGFGYVSMSAEAGGDSSSAGFLTIPITVSYLGVRGASSGLEVGGGATLIYASSRVDSGGLAASGSGMGAWGTAMVGYRYHPAGSAGFQFRVGAMALMGRGLSLSTSRPGSFGVIPWFYLSMGAGF
jgi:hypothetical protein